MDQTNNIFLQKTKLQTLDIINSVNKSGNSDICYIYLQDTILDLTCDIYLIDNTNLTNIILPNPTSNQKMIITLILNNYTSITPLGLVPVTVTTSNGIFYIDNTNYKFELFYNASNWFKIGNNTSMYPTNLSPEHSFTTDTGFSYNTAISSDGNTIAFSTVSSVPNIYISTFISNTWVTKTIVNLYPSNNISLSLSADGKTIAIGSSTNTSNNGIWVYGLIENNWVLQYSTLSNTNSVYFGYCVSLSSDGNTLAVGDPDISSLVDGIGNVRIYFRTNTIWVLQIKLISTISSITKQGRSVSLSSDGNTLAYGATNSSKGCVCVWNRDINTNVWTEYTYNPITGDGNSTSELGHYISLSSNGKTLALSDTHYNGNIGTVYIYVLTGSTWDIQGTPLIFPDAIVNSYIGTDLSLSADGNIVSAGGTLVITTPPSDPDNPPTGPYMWYRSGNVWNSIPVTFIPHIDRTMPPIYSHTGFGVSSSAIGNTIITTTGTSSTINYVTVYR